MKKKRKESKIKKLERRQSQRLPVLLDTAKIRSKYQAEYERVEKELAGKREAWRAFNEIDRPSYSRWINVRYGKELSEIRSLGEELRFKQLTLERIEYERRYRGGSYSECYQRVVNNEDLFTEEQTRFEREDQDGQGNGDPYDDPFEDDEDDFDDDIYDDLDDGFDDDFDDDFDEDGFPGDFKDVFKDVFRGLFGDKISDEDFSRIFHRNERTVGTRIKDTYRILCKILHPDTGATFDEKTSALWHEAQDAYARKDLEKLEALLSIAEMKGGKFLPRTSCSQIIDATRHKRSEIHSIEYEIRVAKKDPAWNFSSKPDSQKSKAEKKFSRTLSKEIEVLRKRKAYLEARLKKWENPQASRKKGTKQGFPNLSQMEFGF